MGIDADRLAVVPLHSGAARDATLTGAKAANLARAAAAGLPVLPGFVVVPAERVANAPTGEATLRRAWEELAGGRPVVVRSSFAREDTDTTSMAGRFASVLDVRGWEDFTTAVQTVLDSSGRALPAAGGQAAEMAVLVQPMLRAAVGGVMFGADPVAGRTDRVLVSAVPGGPDRLVGGSTQGVRYELTPLGRLVGTEPPEPRRDRLLRRSRLSRLVRLAKDTRRVFGGPQDVEFGFDSVGRLWLFQSRPVTAMAPRPPRGARLLGPGPVADTFPHVLQPLEEDLWVVPMSHGLTVALDLAGAVPRRRLRAVAVVRTVDGRAVADLQLLGAAPRTHPVLHSLNPAPGVRRASAAWRVGRLRAALPLLARDLMADVDRQLADFPAPQQMLNGRLLDAVSWGRDVLSALHAQESLAGALLRQGSGATAAGEALAVLAEERSNGRAGRQSETDLIARHPVLLALLPPTLGDRSSLPGRTGWTGVSRGVGRLPAREGLRLRIRWVQEMQATMVRELATRYHLDTTVDGRPRIALLRWAELRALGAGAQNGTGAAAGLPQDFAARRPRPQAPPLPPALRLAAGGRPVPVSPSHGHGHDHHGGEGQGASGGFSAGVAWDGTGPRPERPVLVVRVLDPTLAPLLPELAGLVSETGSVLSHLAVLARERRVPAVVGVADALERFPPGTPMVVDGALGSVERAGAEAAAPAEGGAQAAAHAAQARAQAAEEELR